MGKIIITYWPIRGVAHSIQWLCEQGKVQYEMRAMNPALWKTEKATLDMDFPNLPHLQDGSVRMSESNAILKYIAKKCGMMPETEQEIIASDVAEGVMGDMRGYFRQLVFTPTYDTDKLKYPELVKAKLALFDKLLGKRPFLAGDRVTWLDFVLYESVDVNSLFVPGILDDFSNVLEFKARIESLDGIAAYRESGRFKAWPVTAGPANWGKVEGETIHD